MKRAIATFLSLSCLVLACRGVVPRSASPVDATGPTAQVRGSAAAAPGHDASSSAELLAEARSAIAEHEYRVSRTDAGLQAPNRAHDLRTYFERTGIRVHDRTADGPAELLRMSLIGLGRGNRVAEVGIGREVVHDLNRVEIRRPDLVEWYENSEAGLEQGFTIGRRPAAADGDLVVEIAVVGASAHRREDAISLFTESGRILAYDKLTVVDANGTPLAAHFEVPTPDRIRLVVDDDPATYPLTIDPLLTSTADAQIESNQVGGNLGVVASAGDVNGDGYDDLVVGSQSFGATSVQIFLGGPTGVATSGTAQADATLTGGFLERFGSSAASAGDVNGDGFDDVIVGAPGTDAGQGFQEGAAYIFLGSSTGIASGNTATAATRLVGGQGGALFGTSVASAGDVDGDGHHDVIVGAIFYDRPETDEGAAFLFRGSAAGIANGSPATATTVLESNQIGAALGASVASAGDVNADGFDDVIVGASAFDDGTLDEGAAFVFLGGATGIANGSPATAATILESNQSSGGGGNAPNFGGSVAAAGDVNGDGYADVIVGANAYDNGQLDEGAAFVFHGSATGVAHGNPTTATALLESNLIQDGFGSSVAGAGDINGDGYADVLVGDVGYDAGFTNQGAVFVFVGSLIGTFGRNPSEAYRQIALRQAFAALGSSVASAGDLNRDGFDDVVFGAPLFDAGQDDEGAAFVYHGWATMFLQNSPVTTLNTTLPTSPTPFITNVASAGDINGDGFDDVILGAPDYDPGQSGGGAAFLFHGRRNGISLSTTLGNATTVLGSDQAGASVGSSVASAGDVDGDGYADLIVGASRYDAGEADEGAAFVFRGSASGIASGTVATASARIEANQAGANLGTSVASAGDVNGDGLADVIVGASAWEAGEIDEGAAFVFLGRPSGIPNGSPATAHARLESNQIAASMGASVASAGDVDGDGYVDVIVGANLYDAGQADEGAAFVFRGSANGIAHGNPATAATRLEGNQSSAGLGGSVASAGDFNGDGYADVIVGADRWPSPTVVGQLDGRAGVFVGSASGVANGNFETAFADLVFAGTASFPGGRRLGYAVTSAGDINGDGYGDVLVTAPFLNLFGDKGAVLIFRGTASAGPVSVTSILDSINFSYFLGTSIATGDTNGDGAAAIIVGRSSNLGCGAEIFSTNNPFGRPVLIRQRRGDGSGLPVQPGGAAYSTQSFVAELFVTNPTGRARAKIEIEVCPVGAPFGSAACIHRFSPSWTDLGTTGALFSQTVTGLSANTTYAWHARALTIPFSSTQSGIVPIVRLGPWFGLQGRTLSGVIRTVPEPGLGFGLIGGGGALTLWAGRRRAKKA